MFYLIHQYFDINLFQYITVRAGIGFFISFFLTLFLMPKFIYWAKNKNNTQPIYSLAPKTHQQKSKTPTMGGIIFITSSIIATIFSARLDNIFVIGAILTLLLFSLIGFKDDYSKIVSNKNEAGLSPKNKLFLQIFVSLIISIILYFNLNSLFYIPFYKNALFDMGIFSIFFWIVVIVGSSNAINLTDGLDGLATVPSILAFTSLAIIIYLTGHAIFSKYLLLPFIKNSGELAIVATSLIGSLVAFLWYNSHPAEIFMGDSGSLSLGAFMGYMAIVSKSEILLFLIGFIFVLETISVILQVGSFKLRKKRVFLMAPIHHHFEQLGWHENKVIVRFWIVAFLTNLIALASLKIR